MGLPVAFARASPDAFGKIQDFQAYTTQDKQAPLRMDQTLIIPIAEQ